MSSQFFFISFLIIIKDICSKLTSIFLHVKIWGMNGLLSFKSDKSECGLKILLLLCNLDLTRDL
ncbi:hypothetical protein BpHYR1_007165 [Brachionus plicatilis]|uniref:Uncharacterized protein n=1 Tax=Brachionus plicatilis TaxID=10195 RepID=A0A3M7S6V6_BRAPC|nr:hypothetical protein BpHYR1_007165 [Brachionus plicatilis]